MDIVQSNISSGYCRDFHLFLIKPEATTSFLSYVSFRQVKLEVLY